ncbi:hypothetical protein DFS34DRAFT_609308 [Phlyctochytrium arcticum]|nr:hypothetical protein DFS34DRAFT_609308 [Phlyctochytrium arcticum]
MASTTSSHAHRTFPSKNLRPQKTHHQRDMSVSPTFDIKSISILSLAQSVSSTSTTRDEVGVSSTFSVASRKTVDDGKPPRGGNAFAFPTGLLRTTGGRQYTSAPTPSQFASSSPSSISGPSRLKKAILGFLNPVPLYTHQPQTPTCEPRPSPFTPYTHPSYPLSRPRTLFLSELLTQVRTTTCPAKRAQLECFLLKVVEKEIDRACHHAVRRMAMIDASMPGFKTRIGDVTNPFKMRGKELTAIRSLFQEYVDGHVGLAHEAAVGKLGFSSLSPEEEVERVNARIEMQQRLFTSVQEWVNETTRKFPRSKIISETLTMLMKLEVEFHLLNNFILQTHSEIHALMGIIESVVSKSRIQSIGELTNALTYRLGHIYQTLSTSRSFLTNFIPPLIPSPTDYSCPICLQTLHKPTRLSPCHHTFCRECLHQHDRFSAFCAYLYWVDIQCPMCRGSYSIAGKVDDGGLDNFVRTYFPQEYAHQKRDAFKSRLKRSIRSIVTRKFSCPPHSYY